MQGKDRTLLTTFATKMREIDPDVWVNAALKNINGDNYIIDDVRYQNELDALTKDNWIIIKLNISDELQIERIKKTYPTNYLDHLKNRDHISERNELSFKSGYPHLTICVDNLDINKLKKMIIDFLTKCIIDDV